MSSPLRAGDWSACGVLPWARASRLFPSFPSSHGVHRVARRTRRLRGITKVCSVVGSGGGAWTSLWVTCTPVSLGVHTQ